MKLDLNTINNIENLLKKKYVAALYNFFNIKSLIISNLKKQIKVNICFLNTKLIFKLINAKFNFSCNLIICNIENLIEVINYIEQTTGLLPIRLISKNCVIENFHLKISKLSINNLLVKLKKTILFNLSKFLKLIKKYEKFINK